MVAARGEVVLEHVVEVALERVVAREVDHGVVAVAGEHGILRGVVEHVLHLLAGVHLAAAAHTAQQAHAQGVVELLPLGHVAVIHQVEGGKVGIGARGVLLDVGGIDVVGRVEVGKHVLVHLFLRLKGGLGDGLLAAGLESLLVGDVAIDVGEVAHDEHLQGHAHGLGSGHVILDGHVDHVLAVVAVVAIVVPHAGEVGLAYLVAVLFAGGAAAEHGVLGELVVPEPAVVGPAAASHAVEHGLKHLVGVVQVAHIHVVGVGVGALKIVGARHRREPKHYCQSHI